MDDLALSDVEPDMPEPVEEDEVARLKSAAADGATVGVLRRGVVGEVTVARVSGGRSATVAQFSVGRSLFASTRTK